MWHRDECAHYGLSIGCSSYPCGTIFECAHYDMFTALVVSSSAHHVEDTASTGVHCAHVRFGVAAEC